MIILNKIRNIFYVILTLFLYSGILLSYKIEEYQIQEYEIQEYQIQEYKIQEYQIKEYEIQEYIIKEINILEKKLNEYIIIEDIDLQYTTSKDFEDSFDNYYSPEALNYDIDWGGVLGKFAVGSGIIICTGVLSIASSAQPQIAFVFATSSKEALKEALIGAAIGGALNTIIDSIKRNGTIDKQTFKSAIEGMADGFMWGAVSGATFGAIKAKRILSKNPLLDETGKLLGIPDETGKLLDASGKVRGKILDNGFIEDNAHKIIGKLDDNNQFIRNYKSYIPQNNLISTAKGKIRFKILNNNVYRIGNNEYVGIIDDAGRILKDGRLVGAIDESGKLIPSIAESVSKNVVLSADNVVLNLNNFQIQHSAEKGIRNILGKNGMIAGQIDDSNRLITTWRENLTRARNLGVKSAKSIILKNRFTYEEALNRGIIHKSVTKNMYKSFLESGGKGLEGHHIKNVANYPNYASRSDNIIFIGREAHKHLHRGSFANPTRGNFTRILK
ncbi:hypothetical protein [Brachyspira intermedia]|uniref:hypothetical protein n=1 Tax=Brachyspira intermedia TaxID=84377 RepID=UPI003007E014